MIRNPISHGLSLSIARWTASSTNPNAIVPYHHATQERCQPIVNLLRAGARGACGITADAILPCRRSIVRRLEALTCRQKSAYAVQSAHPQRAGIHAYLG